jgi:hypothetical protein
MRNGACLRGCSDRNVPHCYVVHHRLSVDCPGIESGRWRREAFSRHVLCVCVHWYFTSRCVCIGAVPVGVCALVLYQQVCVHWYCTSRCVCIGTVPAGLPRLPMLLSGVIVTFLLPANSLRAPPNDKYSLWRRRTPMQDYT